MEGTMKRLIQLTSRSGGPIYINPDHIVTVSAGLPGGTAEHPAVLVVSAPFSATQPTHEIHVEETVRQVAEMIEPPPREDRFGFH
jgi:hypothetical protein